MGTFNIEQDDCIKFIERFKTAKKFAKAFREEYSHILAYHCTNLSPLEHEAIRLEGLAMCSKEQLMKKAYERFIDAKDTPETKDAIRGEIDLYFSKTDITTGEIYFGLVKEFLMKDCYQYLLFGSELLIVPASRMSHGALKHLGINFRARQRDYGVSCVIAANIPVETTHDMWINQIYEYWMRDGHEAPLVYKHNLPAHLIQSMEIVDKPYDHKGIVYY